VFFFKFQDICLVYLYTKNLKKKKANHFYMEKMKYVSFISKQEKMLLCVNKDIFSSMQICKIPAFYFGQLSNTALL